MTTRPSSGAPTFRRPTQGEAKGFQPLTFIQEVISELRKAVWPSREETFRLTWVVLIIGGLVGVMLGLFDFTISHTLTQYVILP